MAFAARGLGVAMFGMLVLIHSYAQAASGIAKFQSWQLIVRYGGPALAKSDPEVFQHATGFAFALDVSSGVLGMLGAILLLPFVGTWFGLPDQYFWLAMLYCTLLPTMSAATPTGVLRALDRFDLISWQGTVNPIARASLTLIAFVAGLGFPWYVLIWFVTDLGSDLFLWFLAVRELRRRKLFRGIRPAFRTTTMPGAWRFAINVNLTSSLNAARGPIVNVLVGVVLSPAAAGLYRVAKTLADSVDKPADLLGKAFFPEVMRLNFAGKKPWKLMLRSATLAALIGTAAALVAIVAGPLLLAAAFGSDFVGAYQPLLIMLVGTLLTMSAFPVIPMLYALDQAHAPLVAKALGAIALLASLVPLASQFGVNGAALAYAIGNLVALAAMILALWRQYARVRAS
jgi:O-antigen/teichoic acid export membrane protein